MLNPVLVYGWIGYNTSCMYVLDLYPEMLVVIIFGGINRNCILKVTGLKVDGTQ